jgi:hypothetical protein
MDVPERCMPTIATGVGDPGVAVVMVNDTSATLRSSHRPGRGRSFAHSWREESHGDRELRQCRRDRGDTVQVQ